MSDDRKTINNHSDDESDYDSESNSDAESKISISLI